MARSGNRDAQAGGEDASTRTRVPVRAMRVGRGSPGAGSPSGDECADGAPRRAAVAAVRGDRGPAAGMEWRSSVGIGQRSWWRRVRDPRCPPTQDKPSPRGETLRLAIPHLRFRVLWRRCQRALSAADNQVTGYGSASWRRVCLTLICVVTALGSEAADISGAAVSELSPLIRMCVSREQQVALDEDLRGALSHARALVESGPESEPAWTHLGMIYDVHRRPEIAVGCYARALQLAPHDPRLAYLFAFAADQAGLSDGGVDAAYQRAIRLSPRYGPLRVRWAEYLLRIGRLAEARAAFVGAINLVPAEKSARARRGLGLVLLAMGDAKGAALALRSVLELRSDDGPTWAGLSRGYHLLGMGKDAQIAMDRSRGLQDRLGYFDIWRLPVLEEAVTPPLVEERIMAKLGMGHPDDALADALRWERRHPEWPSIKRFVGNLYRELGREVMAQQYFDAATRRMEERHDR